MYFQAWRAEKYMGIIFPRRPFPEQLSVEEIGQFHSRIMT